MPKGKLKKVNLCHTFEYGKENDLIKGWIENNGGVYSKGINEDVTHFVCTAKSFKKNIDAVKKAKRVRGLKIVSIDWLKDTLWSKGQGLKPEGPYLWDKTIRKNRKKEMEMKRSKEEKIKEGVKAFEAGVKAFQDDMDAKGYHLYTDNTGFTYHLTLARAFLLTNRNERYHLKVGTPSSSFSSSSTLCDSASAPPSPEIPPCFPLLLSSQLIILPPSLPEHINLRVPVVNPLAQSVQLYESHDVPHTYAAYVKFSRPGKTGTDMLAPVASSFETAFHSFRKFFQSRTGKVWEDRLDGIKPPAKVGADGEPTEWFRYEVPKGAAKGAMPGDMVAKELKRKSATPPSYADVAAFPKPAELVLKLKPVIKEEPMLIELNGPLIDFSTPQPAKVAPLLPAIPGSSSALPAKLAPALPIVPGSSTPVAPSSRASAQDRSSPHKEPKSTTYSKGKIAAGRFSSHMKPFDKDLDPRIKQKCTNAAHSIPHQFDPPNNAPKPGFQSRTTTYHPPSFSSVSSTVGHPDVIDLTGDDKVDTVMAELASLAEATKGTVGMDVEWSTAPTIHY